MTVDEARAIINDPNAELPALVEAAAVFHRNMGSDNDLLACLRRGGLVAEFACLALQRRYPDRVYKSVDQTKDWITFLTNEDGLPTVEQVRIHSAAKKFNQTDNPDR